MARFRRSLRIFRVVAQRHGHFVMDDPGASPFGAGGLVCVESTVFSGVKHQRQPALVVGLGHPADDDRMVARIMGGFEVALKSGQRPLNNRHPAMGQMHRHVFDGGF